MEDEESHILKTSLNIWLIEDNEQYRTHLRGAFQQTKRQVILEEFSLCESAIESLEKEQKSPPTVILLDMSLPGGMNGLTGLGHFRRLMPSAKIIILTITEDDKNIYQTIHCGADGFVVKLPDVKKTVEDIYDVIDEKKRIVNSSLRPPIDPINRSQCFQKKYKLTSTETHYIQLVIEGYSKKNLPDLLYRTKDTINDHLKSIYVKMDVHDFSKLVHRILTEEC